WLAGQMPPCSAATTYTAAATTPVGANPAATGGVRKLPTGTRNPPTHARAPGRPREGSDAGVTPAPPHAPGVGGVTEAQTQRSGGRNGTAQRRKPYVPSLSRIPARSTGPAVGASTCASGSQVWNGNIGTLIANARKNAPNSQKASGPRRPMLAITWP